MANFAIIIGLVTSDLPWQIVLSYLPNSSSAGDGSLFSIGVVISSCLAKTLLLTLSITG